jgi:hypothetical protein
MEAANPVLCRLSDTPDAGDGAFRKGTLLLLGPGRHFDNARVGGFFWIVDPEISSASVVIVDHEHHRFGGSFSKRIHRFLTSPAIGSLAIEKKKPPHPGAAP